MAFNTLLLSGRNGIIRILTLVLGLISLSLAANTCIRSWPAEEFFLAISIILFICSLFWLILSIVEVVSGKDKRLDLGLHFVGGLVLLVAAILWTISAFETDLRNCSGIDIIVAQITKCQPASKSLYAKRIVAGICGVINGVLYIVLGLCLFKG